MIVRTTRPRPEASARDDCHTAFRRRDGRSPVSRLRWVGLVAGAFCVAVVGTTPLAAAQKKKPSPKEVSRVTGLVVMTPNGPATCATWIDWRSPNADPADTAAIEFWAEGYLSGLAAGSRHDIIGAFRREQLAAWLTQYCTANPKTPLPEAIVALGLAMLAHPDGKL